MQLLPALKREKRSDAAAFAREAPAGRMLPYLAQVDPHTILLRDGRLMQVLRIEGFLFETADSAEIDYRKELRETMLRAVGTSRFALYHHVVRRRVEPSIEGSFPDTFSQALDEAWSARQRDRTLYANDLYLALIRRPDAGAVGRMGRLFPRFRGSGDDAASRAAEIQALNAARAQVQSSMAAYRPHLLGTVERNGTVVSEPIAYLAALFNLTDGPLRMPHADVGEYLPRRRVSFGHHTAELGPMETDPRRFTAIVSIKDYPGLTTPGMLDSLCRIPAEMTITQSFSFAERNAALGRVGLTLRRMRAVDDEARGLRDELGLAADDLASGRVAFGDHHLTVAVHADRQDELDHAVAQVQAALSDLAIVSVREDLALEPAWWAQFPGNEGFAARKALISTRNFASLASWHNFPLGTPAGNHWGPAITLLETTAAGPYHFNFHHGDLGNFTVIGPSGSGKTVVLNFLIAQAQRIAPRVVMFDKDRGAELFLRAIGGAYHVLRPGSPSGLNPLLLENTSENCRFLTDWITQLVSPSAPLSPQEQELVESAVRVNMQAPQHLRRLSFFAQMLRGSARPHAGDIYARLEPWIGTGENAWLFDNPAEPEGVTARVSGFDMTRLLDDPRTRTPAMMYLFHRVEQKLDGTPTMIVIDEGWKALDDDVFVARIRDWEKTIRKKNGIVGFATQSAEDALESRIASAIVDQAATQIFMPNPRAKQEHYCEGFGLSAHEFELVRSLPDDAHAFLIKHGQHSVVAQLDLTGEQDLLTILSGRESSVRRLDALRAETGDDPAAWMPLLLRKAA